LTQYYCACRDRLKPRSNNSENIIIYKVINKYYEFEY